MIRPLIICVLVSVGCADVGTRVRIVDHDDRGNFVTRDVELTTLVDLDRVRGEIARMWGGATVRADPALTPGDAGTSRDAYVRDAAPVRLAWVADGDVAVPTDFDSLTMVTAYAHFEAVAEHFAALGVGVASDTVPVYYNPTVDKPDDVEFPEYDNAAYFPEADSFLLFPPRALQQVPLAMNPGVLGHEYSHRVLYYQLFGGEMFASVEEHRMDAGSLNAWNRLRATDEGVADFFGAAISNDPNFLSASAPGDIAEPRDLREKRIIETAWLNGLEPVGEDDEYARYLPGAVVAAALWRISEIAGLEVTERAVLAAQANLYDQVRHDFEYDYGDLEAAVIEQLPASARDEACDAMHERYMVAWAAFASACP